MYLLHLCCFPLFISTISLPPFPSPPSLSLSIVDPSLLKALCGYHILHHASELEPTRTSQRWRLAQRAIKSFCRAFPPQERKRLSLLTEHFRTPGAKRSPRSEPKYWPCVNGIESLLIPDALRQHVYQRGDDPRNFIHDIRAEGAGFKEFEQTQTNQAILVYYNYALELGNRQVLDCI